MGDRTCAYRVLAEIPKEKRPRGRPKIDWEILLKWISKKWCGEAWTESIWLRIGEVAGSCECGNEPSRFHKMRGIS
jgi:hypothetical protein